MILKAQMVT